MDRGFVVGRFGVLGLVCFRVLVFSSVNLSFFWLFLELATLAVVPIFFIWGDYRCLPGLFRYIIASGISSSFILCGVLRRDLMFILLIGLLLKFGLFPL